MEAKIILHLIKILVLLIWVFSWLIKLFHYIKYDVTKSRYFYTVISLKEYALSKNPKKKKEKRYKREQKKKKREKIFVEGL